MGEEGDLRYVSLLCHHQNDFLMKMSSCVRQSQDSVRKPHVLKRAAGQSSGALCSVAVEVAVLGSRP